MSEEPQQPPQDSALKKYAKKWIEQFERVVRQKDYEAGKALCHEQVVWFGLESNLAYGWKDVEEKEWKEVWPNQLGFTLDQSRVFIMDGGASIMIGCAWVARSKIAGAPAREGRATFSLGIFDADNKILCTHCHMSMNPKKGLVK